MRRKFNTKENYNGNFFGDLSHISTPFNLFLLKINKNKNSRRAETFQKKRCANNVPYFSPTNTHDYFLANIERMQAQWPNLHRAHSPNAAQTAGMHRCKLTELPAGQHRSVRPFDWIFFTADRSRLGLRMQMVYDSSVIKSELINSTRELDLGAVSPSAVE